MALRQSIDHARPGNFAEVLARTGAALAKLRARHDDGSLPLLRLPEKRDDIATILGYATLLRDGTSDVVTSAAQVPIMRPPTFAAKLSPVPRRCVGNTRGR